MSTLFISDLHLDPARPQVTELFLRFCRDEARHAEALYLLGDVFEAYLGDDDDSAEVEATCSALRDLRAAGVACHFLRGNRDFLVGVGFAERSGCTLLPDPAVILLQGEPTLVLHGDLLCTDDTAYQAFRRQVRAPQWQAQFLAQPLAVRRAFAEKARSASKAHQQQVSETITDVNPDEVTRWLMEYGVRRMIHGHTHRPAIHDVGQRRQRIVLGDWYEQGSVLRVDADGVALSTLS